MSGCGALTETHPDASKYDMKTDGQLLERQSLKEGQLWRLKGRYVLIVALENLCVRFKLMDRPDQQGERTLTGDIDTLWRYLTSRHAKVL